MYRIKGPYRKIQVRTIFLLLLCFLLKMEMDAQITTYYKVESFLFSFRRDNDLFLADYGDNAYQLERMGGLLDVSRDQILKGDNHLLIVSHVSAYEYEDTEVVNEASLRAGRIRAYLKLVSIYPMIVLPFISTVAEIIVIRCMSIRCINHFRGLRISRFITVKVVTR